MSSLDDTVHLEPHSPLWAKRFELEYSRIKPLLPRATIEHIGSTAIPGLPAKPIIDIIIGVPDQVVFDDYLNVLQQNGYILEGNREYHAWLCRVKGARRSYIAHLVLTSSTDWRNRRAFRDYLITHSEVAKQYLELKTQLAQAYGDDLGRYTKAKGEFVARITAVALERG